MLLLGVDAAHSSVSVGDPDSLRHRELLVMAAGSGSGGGGNTNSSSSACPNVTTVAIAPSSTGASSVRITSATDCKGVVVSTEMVDKVVDLDLRSRSIVAIESLPTDVQSLRLSNNSIASLANVALPTALLTLDVSSNALTSLANVTFPLGLTLLNASRNPLTSFANVSLPATLTQLDLTRARLAAFELVALPAALTTLDLSGNPIKRVAGVAFPKRLTRLSLRSNAKVTTTTETTTAKKSATDSTTATDSTSQDAVLDEFEVRQADAALFVGLKSSFDVAPTTKATCSDTRAKNQYVKDTMLCVLTDDVFDAKYSSLVDSSNATSAGTTDAPLLPVLDETFDQRRSWFLIASSVALCSVVVCVCIVALGHRMVCRKKHNRNDSRADRATEQATHSKQQLLWRSPRAHDDEEKKDEKDDERDERKRLKDAV